LISAFNLLTITQQVTRLPNNLTITELSTINIA